MKKMLLGVLMLFLLLTLLAVAASLGNGSKPVTTTAKLNTSTTTPTTTVPSTTAPTTTAPPASALTPEELAQRIEPCEIDCESHRTDTGFYLAAGHPNGAYVPIEVSEVGIYSVTFGVKPNYSSNAYYAVYMSRGYTEINDGFVTEVFSTCDSRITMDIELIAGTNYLFFFTANYNVEISSVSYTKLADYDIAITDFTGSGAGVSIEWSGNPRLNYEDGTDISKSVIRSEKIVITQDGAYNLSFIAGSKCIPHVRIVDSNEKTVATVDYSVKWNAYGVVPDYNNASTVYIPATPLDNSDSSKTIELTAGEYYLEVMFGDNYKNGDTILVHSAYLTKVN